MDMATTISSSELNGPPQEQPKYFPPSSTSFSNPSSGPSISFVLNCISQDYLLVIYDKGLFTQNYFVGY